MSSRSQFVSSFSSIDGCCYRMPKCEATARDYELLQSFARRVKELRLAGGVTARELAAEMRMHVSAIYNIERGVHALSLNRLPEFARALRVEVLDLFTFVEHSPRHALVDFSRHASPEALLAAHHLLCK